MGIESQVQSLFVQVFRDSDEKTLSEEDYLWNFSRLFPELLPKGWILDRWENHFGEAGMPCKSCGSVNQKRFGADIGIHFPGLKNIDKPVVRVFPELVVCLDCGASEFPVPEAALRQLAKIDAT